MAPTNANSDSGPKLGFIAVAGLSCRLRGVASPADLWRSLDESDSDFTSFPGVVENAESSSVEEGLALELVWDALEDAAVVPARLNDTVVGVFVGAAGEQVAEQLGTHGPVPALDERTPASTAVHIACQSLRAGESDLALAGAVLPDGYGCVLALKPLSAAVTDGDPVYCVIDGSALGGGGEDVVQHACEQAGVQLENIQHMWRQATGVEDIVAVLGLPLLIKHRRTASAVLSSVSTSGTTCALVLSGRPEQDRPERATSMTPPWLLSGISETALRASASRLRTHLDGTPDISPLDVGHSLATARTHFQHRAVVLAEDLAGYRDALAGVANGKQVTPAAKAGRKIAFLFAGEGGQRVHMGRELYPVFSVFADALDEVCAHLEKNSGWPVRDVLVGSGVPRMDPVDQELFTQDALFALQVALFRLLDHLGLHADFVMGHSFGELAAATVAGVFSLPEVTALMAERARLLHATMPVGGAMVAMRVSEQDIRDSLRGYEHAVRVSAVNSPTSVVISGDREAVREIAGLWASRGRKVKELPVTRAFHSPHVDAMAAGFAQFMRGLSRATPKIPVVPIHHGRITDPDALCAPGYWEAQMRGTGHFLDCVRTLESAGVDTYIELSANGALASLIEECLSEETDALATAALHGSEQSDLRAVLGMLGQMHVHGVAVDWDAVFRGWGGRRVHLPTAGFRTRPSHEPRAAALASTRELLELIRTEAADILKHTSFDRIRPDDSFLELGIDSLGAVELVKRLKAATGLHLTAPVIFNHPTPAALAGYLHDRALRAGQPAMDEDTSPVDVAAALRADLIQRLEALTNEQIFALIDDGFDVA